MSWRADLFCVALSFFGFSIPIGFWVNVGLGFWAGIFFAIVYGYLRAKGSRKAENIPAAGFLFLFLLVFVTVMGNYRPA